MALPNSTCRFSLRFYTPDGELIAAFNSNCERTIRNRQKGAEAHGLNTKLLTNGN